MKNKFRKAVIASVAALGLVSFSLQGQAAAGWQLIGYDYVDPNGTDWTQPDEVGQAFTLVDGGNAGLRVYDMAVSSHGGSEAVLQIQAYEDDGASGDDFIGTAYYYPQDHSGGYVTYTFDLQGMADGDNGKAEVQFKYTYNFNGEAKTFDVLD